MDVLRERDTVRKDGRPSKSMKIYCPARMQKKIFRLLGQLPGYAAH